MDSPSTSLSLPQVLRPGGAYKPEIRLDMVGGRLALIKDFGVCGRWFRCLIGRWLVKRECQVLEAIEGLPGVPRLLGRPSSEAIAVEYVGRALPLLDPEKVSETLWADLERTVRTLHEHGVAHGDLKTLENIVVDEAGAVYLVDLNSAVFRRGLLGRILFSYLAADDRRAIIKAKWELHPHLVTPAEKTFLNHQSLAERIFRRVRRPIRRFAKWLGGKRKTPGPGRPSVQRKRQRETSMHDGRLR